MSRQVKIGELVVDHFPVFEEDGYTKKSGLLVGDFSATLYHDSVGSIIPVVITEVGAGEYSFAFTPDAAGDWDVEVHILYNHDIWVDSFSAVTSLQEDQFLSVLEQCGKIDLIPTVGPASATSGSLIDRMMNKGAGKTYNQGTDSLEALRDLLG